MSETAITTQQNDSADTISHYSKMLDELNNKTRAEITVINIPYIGSEQILLPPWNTLLDWRMQQFNKIIQEVAKKRSIKVIDLYTATKNQFIKSSDLYSVDQFHPAVHNRGRKNGIFQVRIEVPL